MRKQFLQGASALAAVCDPRNQAAMRWNIVQSMNRVDPAAAQRWIEAQPTDNEVKASWMVILENSL